jgi:hypothetical protein
MNTPNTDPSSQQQQRPGDKPQSPGRGAPGGDQPKDRPPGQETDNDRGAQRPGQSRPNDPDRDPDRGGHGAGQTDE